MTKIFEYLQNNEYPGRGILIGRSSDGENINVFYFLMGRSTNSKNRVIVKTDIGVETKAHDPALMVDPSLIIYNPVVYYNNYIVVTNGDQTDSIYESLKIKGSFEEALRQREYEPDPPNFTPRISGLISKKDKEFDYKLSILKKAPVNDGCERFFYEYTNVMPGYGHFIHTYKNNNDPLESFEGEPVLVRIDLPIEEYAARMWDSLNPAYKVSLFAVEINIKTDKTKEIFYNINTDTTEKR